MKINWNKSRRDLLATFFVELAVAWSVVGFVNSASSLGQRLVAFVNVAAILCFALLLTDNDR